MRLRNDSSIPTSPRNRKSGSLPQTANLPLRFADFSRTMFRGVPSLSLLVGIRGRERLRRHRFRYRYRYRFRRPIPVRFRLRSNHGTIKLIASCIRTNATSTWKITWANPPSNIKAKGRLALHNKDCHETKRLMTLRVAVETVCAARSLADDSEPLVQRPAVVVHPFSCSLRHCDSSQIHL